MAAYRVEVAIDQQRKIVGRIAEQREPARVLDYEIEHITMHNQIASSVRGFMNGRLQHFDAAEVGAIITAQKLVVIAGKIDDAGAFAGLPEQLLHHIIVMLRPVPSGAQLPAVDDVPDQVNSVGVVIAQEIEQTAGLATACTEVNVGNEERAESDSAVLKFHESCLHC